MAMQKQDLVHLRPYQTTFIQYLITVLTSDMPNAFLILLARSRACLERLSVPVYWVGCEPMWVDTGAVYTTGRGLYKIAGVNVMQHNS